MLPSRPTLRRRCLATLLALVVALPPALVQAATPDPFVSRASDLMDEAEYAKAQRTINRGLGRRGLEDATLLELYLLEGTCWVSLGQAARARSSYAKVLTIDPGYTLGSRVSPKVRAAFEATRQEMIKAGDLESVYQLEHTPVGNLAPGLDAEVRLAFGNEERAADIKRVVLHVRRLGTSDFAAIDAGRDDVEKTPTFLARIPPYLLAEEREAYAMEYYLEAYTDGSRRVAGVGSPVLPLSFLVVPAAELEAGLDEPEGELPLVPIAIGVGVGVVVIASVAAGAVLLLAPKTGSATVHVTQ